MLGNPSSSSDAIAIGTSTPTTTPTTTAKLTIVTSGDQNAITASNGTINAPAYSFVSTNTSVGMYSPGQNQLALVTSQTARLLIDATGSVSQYSQYKAHAYVSSSQAGITNTTATIIFNTKLFDPNSNFNTATGVYTTPISGYYWVTTNVTFTSNTTVGNGATRSCNFVRNGTAITGYSTSFSGWTATGIGVGTNGTGPYSMHSTGLIQLNGGDQLRVDYTNTNGAGVTDTISTNDTHFSAHLCSTV